MARQMMLAVACLLPLSACGSSAKTVASHQTVLPVFECNTGWSCLTSEPFKTAHIPIPDETSSRFIRATFQARVGTSGDIGYYFYASRGSTDSVLVNGSSAQKMPTASFESMLFKATVTSITVEGRNGLLVQIPNSHTNVIWNDGVRTWTIVYPADVPLGTVLADVKALSLT